MISYISSESHFITKILYTIFLIVVLFKYKTNSNRKKTHEDIKINDNIYFIKNQSYTIKNLFNKSDVINKNVVHKNIDIPQFYYKDRNVFLSKAAIKAFNDYMNICNKGILIDKTQYNLTKYPKISVIIPLYNGIKFLKYSLRSVQNQKLKNIEIIIVNDCSNNNSLEIIENYKKEDPRIRLINNEKNRRILYSKSIGALFSNGKYIIQLDQDDIFITDNAFNSLYKEAENNNYDLIQFQDFTLDKLKFIEPVIIGKAKQEIQHNEESYLEQPKLKNEIFKHYNFLLWGLLIKNDFYKKAIYTLWPIIINYKIVHLEDFHITFLIVAYVKSFKFINRYYLVHLTNKNSAGNDMQFNQDLSNIFFPNSMIEYHIKKNPKDISMLDNYIYIKRNFLKRYEKNFKSLFKLVITKIYEYLPYEKKIYYRDNYQLKIYKINNTYEYFTNKKNFNSISAFQNLIQLQTKKIFIPFSLFPKYSIIIYTIKSEFLKITINSIGYQNFSDYELILICDNCNNLSEIKELIKDYYNIILIINEVKKGLLSSYCEAILKSKGEYILTIKSGYAFTTNDILYKLNKFLYKTIDIFEFNLIINYKELIDDNSLKIYKCKHFKSEINIDPLIFNQNFKKIDQEKELVINKLINSKIYKKIINENLLLYKDKIIDNYYDEIIFFLFKKNNIIIKNVNIIGLIEYTYIKNSLEQNNIMDKKIQIITDSLFYINFLFDKSQDTKNDKLFALNEFYNILNIIVYNELDKFSEKRILLIYKFLNNSYIPLYNKNLLKTYYNAWIDRNRYDIIS